MKKTWWIWALLIINLGVLIGGFLLVRGIITSTLQPITEMSNRIGTVSSILINPTIVPDL
jgi:hypothetical protein